MTKINCSHSDEDAAVALLLEGETTLVVSRLLGVSPSRVANWASQRNVVYEGRAWHQVETVPKQKSEPIPSHIQDIPKQTAMSKEAFDQLLMRVNEMASRLQFDVGPHTGAPN